MSPEPEVRGQRPEVGFPPPVFRLLISGFWLLALGTWHLGAGVSLSVQTIADPTPVTGDYFGYAVAGISTNAFLISAERKTVGGVSIQGLIYIYTNGVRQTTLTNPMPSSLSTYFGSAISAFGTNSFVVGQYGFMVGGVNYCGLAQIFTNLAAPHQSQAITNPLGSTAISYGWWVAPVDTNGFVVGMNSPGNSDHVYLYTNGVLEATIPDPYPQNYNYFGVRVAGFSTNGFAVSSYEMTNGIYPGAGQLYLYNNDGTLATTITNPAPATNDYFGYTMAGVSTNLFVVASSSKTINGSNFVGQAYLYTNMVLATTISNPVLQASNYFGYAMAFISTNYFIIGAYGTTVAGNYLAGQAYLYDATGTLLTTITNPVPGASDKFGYTIAAVGTNQFIIGAPQKTISSVANVGQAYLYTYTITSAATVKRSPPPLFFHHRT
jgi:hypothetical protein